MWPATKRVFSGSSLEKRTIWLPQIGWRRRWWATSTADFVAPDPHELFDSGAEDVGEDVPLPVRGVRDEHEPGVLQQAVVAPPVTAERPGQGDGPAELDVDEGLDLGVGGAHQGARRLARRMNAHEHRAADRRPGIAIGGESRLHGVGLRAVEADDLEPVAHPRGLRAGAGDGHVRLPGQAEQHFGAAADEDPRDLQGLFPAVAGGDEHGQPGSVHRAHGRARQIGGLNVPAHGHAMGDLELVAVQGGGLVAAEEDAGRRDVVRRRQALALGAVGSRALQGHQVEVLRGGGSGLVAAHPVHGREDRADAIAFDRTREHQIDPDSQRAELIGQAPRPGVHRRLGHHVGGPRIVGRAGEDGRDVDDRRPGPHHRRGGARDVPGHAEDVAQGVADGFGVGRTVRAEGLELPGAEGDLLQRLFGTRRPGVVHEDVDPSEALHDLGDPVADRLRIGAVEDHGGNAALVETHLGPNRRRRRVDAGRGPAGHHHDRALAQIVTDDVAADGARGSGDDGDLAGETPRRLHVGRVGQGLEPSHRFVPLNVPAATTVRAARRAYAAPSPAGRG